MRDALPTPTVLRGTVRNLVVEKTTVDAFQSDQLRTQTGAAGALAAAAGLSGIAAGMVAMSMEEMRENAFGVSFEVDGQRVRGVLWDHPFKDGDDVEVVAEQLDDHWNAFAVARPSDRTIALFPHVVSGEIAHYKTSFKIWIKFAIYCFVFMLVIGGIFSLLDDYDADDWAFFLLAGVLGGGGGGCAYFCHHRLQYLAQVPAVRAHCRERVHGSGLAGRETDQPAQAHV